MPTPMPSASNSCAREKLAIVSLVLASASAVRSGSLPMSVTTRVTTAACRAWSSRIEACLASTCAISWRQHRGQFRGVAGERDQAARHVELAGRQREGVHRARIEDRHLVGLVGTIGRRDQPVDRLADQRFQLRIVIGAAIGGQNALMLALGGRGLRHRAGRLGRMAVASGAGLEPVDVAAGGKRQSRAQQSAAQPKGGGSSRSRAVPHTPSRQLLVPILSARRG